MSFPGAINFPTTLDDAVSLIEARNNAASTLTADLAPGDLLLPVADVTRFSDSGVVTLFDDPANPTAVEIAAFVGKSGSSLVIPTGGRAQQGTTAQSFASGAAVWQTYTAGHHATLSASVRATQAAIDESLLSLVWAAPATESGNKIELTAQINSYTGAPFASGLIDVELRVSDAANDHEPSHTATIGPASSPLGSLLSGLDTATAVMRTNASGQFRIAVSESAPGSRYVWVNGGGHGRFWVRAQDGVQQLVFA